MISLLAIVALAAAEAEASSDVIVQLFEWSWPDVGRECEVFLGPMGYTAVQVSPATEHIQGDQWYTRYQPVSYRLESRSGSEEQFVAAVAACNRAGVKVYVDIIINHMAKGQGRGVAGTLYDSRARKYGTFVPTDFHHLPGEPLRNCNVTDFDHASRWELQNCDILKLPDLCTECPTVHQTVNWFFQKLAGIGVGGFRIDAAKHIPPKQLGEMVSMAKQQSIDVSLEVFTEYQQQNVTPDMYLGIGLIENFEYSGNVSERIRLGQNMEDLPKLMIGYAAVVPSQSAIVFIDNHDMQRDSKARLTYKNGPKYWMANMFMLAWPYGLPKVMSSYHFEKNYSWFGPPNTLVHEGNRVDCGGKLTWVCEHRIPAIANMVAWRRSAGTSPVSHWVAEKGGRIAFGRGSAAFLALHLEGPLTRGTWKAKLQTGLPQGSYCDVSRSTDVATCSPYVVELGGVLEIALPPNSALALHTGCMASVYNQQLGVDLVDASIRPLSCYLRGGLAGVFVILVFAFGRKLFRPPAKGSLQVPLTGL